MTKNFASILITNYNKDKFLKRSINSCFNQNYKKKEIIIFDDCSNDNSKKILKKEKKTSIIFNKKKKSKSGPINQLNGIKKIFKKSKGDIIFLLDSDDYFREKKIKSIIDFFKKDKNLKFIQDVPYIKNEKKLMYLKNKFFFFSIWPSFYPTSCIAMRRSFFKNFLRFIESTKFPNLEIDARLCIYAFLTKKLTFCKKNFTIYNYDAYGITSKYKKFSFNWWKKRSEAFDYMKILMKKLKIKFIPGPDYYFTKIINMFI